LLCALVLWLFASVLLTGRILGPQDLPLYQSPFGPTETPHVPPSNPFLFDAVFQFHPDMDVARAELRHFQLPLWTPYQAAGTPLLATQQNAIFFPINWLAIVFPFWHSLGWIAALKVLAAAVGTLLFLRALDLRWPAALVGAITFAFSSYLIDWLEHPHVNAYLLIPWLLLGSERLARNRRVSDGLLLALGFGAADLAGQPEATFIVSITAVAWFAVRLATYTRADGLNRAATSRTAAMFVGAVLLGAVVGAVMLVPLIEVFGQSYNLSRGGGPGAPSNLLLGFVAPELWGRPDKFEIPGGPINYVERTAYFGTVPLLLGVAGLVVRRRGPQVFFAVLGLLALGLVVQVPWYTVHIRSLPVLAKVNELRFLILVSFCGAVLAAYGMQALLEESSRRWALLAAACATAALPLVWLLIHSSVFHYLGTAVAQLPNIGHTSIPVGALHLATFLRWALFAALGLLLLAVAALRPRWSLAVALLLVALASYDLVSFARGFHPAEPASFDRPAAPPSLAFVERTIGHDRVAGGNEFGPNLSELYGLRDARGYDLPDLTRRTRLWLSLGGGGPDYYVLSPAPSSLASLFSVRFMFSTLLPPSGNALWRPTRYPQLFENRAPHFRAWVAYGWRVANSMTEGLRLLGSSSIQGDFQTPVIEGGEPPPSNPGPPQEATFLHDGDQSVTLAVNPRGPGYLVLSDTWYPGWSATIDGHPVSIQHANVAFRAVPVSAGHHIVAFTYSPRSSEVAALASLLAVLGIAGGLFIPRAWRYRHSLAAASTKK
jgi:hypothetical protein